jgi:acyl-CoA reductase-like NAD-dependent aldehyde dehydrogenase
MTYAMLIDGERVAGPTGLDVINPATGAVFARCARATGVDLERAVGAARRAFPGWAGLGWAQRRAVLHRLADALEARAEELAALLTAEQGKPLAQARMEVGGSIAAFRYFSGTELADKVLVDDAAALIVEHYAPLGVVAVITPWNFPLILMALKVACALATGNTVVAKPAPTTPLTALLLANIAADLLPAGVLNMIVDANDLGGALSGHPDVAKVTFTGSTATGRKVMESAAGTIKRLTLELGGNDAAIVLDDADIATVAPRIFTAATFNSGQVCTAAKRIYVPRALHDPLCDALADLATGAVVGDGTVPDTTIGPVQNRMQYEKLLEFIEDSRVHGTIIAGGRRDDRPGYYIAPMIVRDLPDTARLVCEEQFGPVVPVLAYDTIDEVVARANLGEFGLAGSVWGSDQDRAIAVARRIVTGTVWVNTHLDLRFDVPFGGARQSGLGREQGIDGLREFVQPHVVNCART